LNLPAQAMPTPEEFWHSRLTNLASIEPWPDECYRNVRTVLMAAGLLDLTQEPQDIFI